MVSPLYNGGCLAGGELARGDSSETPGQAQRSLINPPTTETFAMNITYKAFYMPGDVPASELYLQRLALAWCCAC